MAEKEETPLFLRGDETDGTVTETMARLYVKGSRPKPELTELSFEVDRSISALEAIHKMGGKPPDIDEELKQPGSPLVTSTPTGGVETVRMGLFLLRKFESVYDLRNLMRYYGLTADLQVQAQLNLARPDFIQKYRAHSTVVWYKGWVYVHFLEFNGLETYVTRNFSKHKGGRGGLRHMDQFMIGGLKKR